MSTKGTFPLLLALAACTGDESSSRNNETVGAPASFDSAFVLVDSVKLEATRDAPLVRISGIAVDGSGQFLIADASERVVRIHLRDGRLSRIIGRSGDGPGEFRSPRFVAFTGTNSFVVAEGTGRLHFYEGDSLVLTRQADSSAFISSLSVLPDDQLVVSAADPRGATLTFYDRAGSYLNRTTLVTGTPAPSRPDDPRWQNFYQLWSVACGSKIFAAASISDSIWTLDGSGTKAGAMQATYAGHAAPVLPNTSPNPRQPFEWIKKFDVIQGLLCFGEFPAFSYVRGIRNYGDPQVLMIFDGQAWNAFAHSPPVIAFHGDTAIAIQNPEADDVWLGRYVWSKP